MIIASEQLWETFSVPLQQFIRRRVRDPHSAEDILQDVFLKIHPHRHAAQAGAHRQLDLPDHAQRDRRLLSLAAGDRRSIGDIGGADDLADDDVVRELLPCVAAMVDALPEATVRRCG